MAANLLLTKLYFPPVRPSLVPRPRLVERLRTGLLGPLVGLIGDLTFKFLPKSISEKWRPITAGAVIGSAIFFTTWLARSSFYKGASMDAQLRFFAREGYFCLPWRVANGGFAGCTAYATARDTLR